MTLGEGGRERCLEREGEREREKDGYIHVWILLDVCNVLMGD